MYDIGLVRVGCAPVDFMFLRPQELLIARAGGACYGAPKRMNGEARTNGVGMVSFLRAAAVGAGPARHARRHGRGQCRDRRSGGGAVGLSPAAARAAVDPYALHGAGADGEARRLTGRGHGELIRERFGLGWAWLGVAGLGAATIGSLVTEFTGVAGIGELFGFSRSLTLPAAAAGLLVIVGVGSYRRVERAALVIGLFELAFFAVAWEARRVSRLSRRTPSTFLSAIGDFYYLAAAVIGATFNPWMIYYQQSATVDKKLEPGDLVRPAGTRPSARS